MPSFKKHCSNSKKRTGKDFADLHEWMDAPQKELGISHRIERHDLSYLDFVKEKWGVAGVKEFLRHIAEDYEDTANKWGKNCAYCKEDTWKNNNFCYQCKKVLEEHRK